MTISLALLSGALSLPGALMAGEAISVTHKTGVVASSRCAEMEQSDRYPLARDICQSIEVRDETHRVKGAVGANFGVEYVISGLADQECHTLSHVLFHPEMMTPSGEPRSYYERRQRIGACAGDPDLYADVYSWYIEEPWELVAGEWTFKVLLDGNELISETITVE
ncbi:DUF3859 domain-containing protein [Spongiibacter taiwanensis]|uniref:DUF3859 domain-containing protein n=1 Tax=Spongiibacter taiwanensis TaxID=1748242 RepID=UPI0020352C1C|nr:DUF3859 domain-containing protein [Spongiibacter taiwanensis]USA41688.1 DUF3859 domain-containing protein [Spongiibacter taiwanensis]